MTSKKESQKEARRLRKLYPHLTINVKRISKSKGYPINWGIRFSPKGKRDKFKMEYL